MRLRFLLPLLTCATLLNGCTNWGDVGRAIGTVASQNAEDNDPADKFVAEENWPAAIGVYSKLIEIDPKDAQAWGWRAYCYEVAGHYDKAISDATKALELDPKADWALDSRGKAYENSKRFKQAIDDYTAEIKLKDDDATTYVSRGDCYEDLHEYDKALADYNKAIELDNTDAEAYNNRGWIYVRKNDYKQAITDFENAIAQDENYDVAYYHLTGAYMHLNNEDAALSTLKKLIDNKPDEWDAYLDRGNIFLLRNEPEKALSEFQAVTDSMPTEAVQWAKLYMYLTYKSMKKNKEADETLASAVKDTDSSDWPYPMLLYLSNKLSEQQLLDFCISDRQRANVHQIVGINKLVSGKQHQAASDFQWIAKNDLPSSGEYYFSQRLLKDGSFLGQKLTKTN